MPLPIPFGSYELLERIAEGGMAEVWRARSRGVAGFEKTVVIKRVLPSLLERPGFAELLVREAKIAARLSHPNIVQIFDLGEQEGGYYIAMELLRGRDLAAALSHRAKSGDSPLSLPLRLWIASEVAKALDYAHRAKGDDGKPLNIVHRDVSPQNVLLGFEGEVKVADFGIARADEPGLGRGEDPKILRGKYAYMSPEQARGEPLDRRSDLFSFSILLYELISKRRMFRGKTSAETLELMRRAELPDYTRGVEPPELRAILTRGLAARREDRYASAGEMYDELLRIIFALGKPIGPTDLAQAMRTMFPPLERVSPNKLHVDLLARAYDDATAASDPGRTRPLIPAPTAGVDEHTRALPIARRLSRDTRRLVFFATRGPTDDQGLFEAAVEGTGGVVLPASGGVLLAAYGLAGMERAVGHATRGALELRHTSRVDGLSRLDPTPPMVVLGGEARVLEGADVEPDPALLERATSLLARTDPGEIRADTELRAELGREFRVRAADGDLVVDGFRARRDRDAGALRMRAPLTGRRELLRVLFGLLADTARGSGELVHLLGEPGVGKSRLLAELRAAAAPKDFVFVHGRADEASAVELADHSFGALADLVSDLLGVEPEDTPAQRFEKVERLRVLGVAPRQVRIIGELLGLAYPIASAERIGRPRGIELALAIRKAIRALADDRVVVLAIEDLHWMDDATRQVLPLLVHGLVRSRVLVLLTRRPGTAGPLPSGGRTIEVPALDVESTGRVLAHWLSVREVDPALAALVQRETGGIPAWIELLAEPLRARLTIEGGAARLEGDPQLGASLLPDAIRTVVAARIERLRPRDRSLLRVSAALGGSAEVRVLSAVEGLIGHSERPAVRRLLLRRLWVADGAESVLPERLGAWGGDEDDERLPARVRIPSELLRRAVLRELDEPELRRLHARIVTTLERLGAGEQLEGLEQLAEHAAASIDRRRAPAYLTRAAAIAMERGEPARAARHWVRAASILREESGDPADLEGFELGLRGAEAALAGGALELVTQALAPLTARRAPAELAVRRALLEGRLARRTLTPERAIAALEAVHAALAEVDAPLRDEALGWQAWARLESGDPAACAGLIESALGGAGASSCEGILLGLLATALARLDRLDEADEAVSRGLALAARTGEGGHRYAALAAMAAVLEARGDLAASAARHREAAEVAEGAGEIDGIAAHMAHAAVLSMVVGEDGAASACAERAGRWARQLGQGAWGAVVTALEGALALRGRPSTSHVPSIVAAVEQLEERPLQQAMAVEVLSLAHQALGDPPAAARTLQRAAQIAERAALRSYARRLRERSALL